MPVIEMLVHWFLLSATASCSHAFIVCEIQFPGPLSPGRSLDVGRNLFLVPFRNAIPVSLREHQIRWFKAMQLDNGIDLVFEALERAQVTST
jgi:hypothetical protein